MNKDRIRKLESLSKELISNFIFEELEDSEKTFGIITITGVNISSDLSYLDIYISSLLNTELLTKTLAKHNHGIQRKLNKAINIRKLPRIRFRYDSSGEVGHRISETIKKECK